MTVDILIPFIRMALSNFKNAMGMISEKTKRTDLFLKAAFLVGVLIFLVVNITTLYDGHNWGGDFSQYIIHAVNLVEGRPYADNIALELWVISPPGFPFILMPFIYVFGTNLKILKLINVFFWLLYVFLINDLARRRIGTRLAFWISLVMLSSPYFFWFKQNILSDIPSVFFVTGSLVAITRYFEDNDSWREKRLWLLLALCLMLWAQLIRLAGGLLFIALIAYIFLARKDKKLLILIFGTWLLGLLILWHFGISPSQHLKEIDLTFLQWLRVSYLRIADTVKYIIGFYIPPPMKTIFSAPLFPVLEKTIDILNPLILIGWLAFIGHKFSKRSVSFIAVFFVIYFFAWASWSLSGGERYGLPLYGLAIIFILKYFLKLSGYLLRKMNIKMHLSPAGIVQTVLLILICHNCLSIYQHYHFNDDRIYSKGTQEMLVWIKNNTGPDERFMFYNPRILSLLTNRKAATNWNFWTKPREDRKAWFNRVARLKIDYIIKVKELNDFWFLSEQDEACQIALRLAWENEEYAILKIIRISCGLRPELGSGPYSAGLDFLLDRQDKNNP